MTSDTKITIARGLVSHDMPEAQIAASHAANRCPAIELEKSIKLLDVPQPAQPFLDLFFRSAAFVRDDLLGFLLQHVDHEFINRFVSSRVRTLLYLLQQFAFDLHFV